MPDVKIVLTSAMQAQLSSGGVTGWAVYFDAGGANPTWAELTGSSVTVSPTGAGQKIYFILQSTDSDPGTGNSVDTKISNEADIVPTGPSTSAEALNYRYDSFEVSFTPAAADAGNLTSIEGFGIPMGIEVVYSGVSPATSASRGYHISGGTVSDSGGIWYALASAGGSGSIQYFSAINNGGYATPHPRMAISPATAIANNVAGTTYSTGQWDSYVSSLHSRTTSSATTSGDPGQIQIAGYFNGAKDASSVWHNAGFYAYDVTFDGVNFKLTPDNSSQIRGTITISPDDLANSIYMTLGNATVSGLSAGNGTGSTTTLSMNTGANNQWGAVLRDFIAGFTAGYWNATATSQNSHVSGSIILNKEWNQDPTYAFGGAISSGDGVVTSASGSFYDPYAKVFFEHTNSYGNGYSDFLTRAFDVGPLINVSDGSGHAIDSNDITVTLFADNEQPAGYTSQTINNFISAGTYQAPNHIVTGGPMHQFDFGIGAMSLDPGTPVTIVLKSVVSNIVQEDVRVPLVHSGGSFASAEHYGANYTITGSGSSFSAAWTGDNNPGIIQITGLPVGSAGVSWYQIEVGSSGTAAHKVFNLYETVNSGGLILNPAYTGQAGDLAIDGLATVSGVFSAGTDVSGQQYISGNGALVQVNFQNGGNNSLDPSLMTVVPLSAAAPDVYLQPFAPLVGMRPGYTEGTGAPFLEAYQVWNIQTSQTVVSSNTTRTIPVTNPVTVYNGGLVFGWNGADSAAVQQRAALGSSFVSAYTNRTNGDNIARLVFTATTGSLPTEGLSSSGTGESTIYYTTATADSDGVWATDAPIQFANGTYTVQMQEFLPTDSGFANPLNSASVVQSFTVQQGAVVSNTTLYVNAPQTSTGLIISNDGHVAVNSGGTASATMISAGGVMYLAGGTGDIGSIVIGEHQVWSGTTASDTTIANGGHDYVYGTISGGSVNGGGTQVVGGGGYATSATALGMTLNAGAYQHIKSAGWALSTTVLSGGNQVVESGGYALNTTIYAGGTVHVSSGGSVGSGLTLDSPGTGGPTVSGGNILVHSGGVVGGGTFQPGSGTATIYSGGSAGYLTLLVGTELQVDAGGYSFHNTMNAGSEEKVWGAGASAFLTTLNGGAQHVYSGASTNLVQVHAGGQQNVWGTGTTATSTSIQASGALQYVYSGASAIGTQVSSGGALWAWDASTIVNDATISAGGEMFIHTSAVASGIQLDGGLVRFDSGGQGNVNINATSSIVEVGNSSAGAVVVSGFAVSTGIIDFFGIAYDASVTKNWNSSTNQLTLTSGGLNAAVTLFGIHLSDASDLTYTYHSGGTRVTDTMAGTDVQNLLTQPNG